MLETASKKIDIREYWRIFWRKKFYFFVPFIIGFLIGIIKSYTTTPVYQSSTTVQVSQEQLLAGAMRNLVPGVSMKERLDNLKTLITSHDYLKRLVDNLNLNNHPEMLEKARRQKDNYPGFSTEEICELLWIDRLKHILSIQPIGRTDFIQIVAFSNSPEMAYNLAQTLTQIFIDESLRREVGGIRGALEFGSEQLAIYKKKLEDSEQQLQKFKESIVYDQFDNYSVSEANIDQVNNTLTTTDFELREDKDRLNLLNSQINQLTIKYKLPRNDLIVVLKKELLEATLELSKLMLKYTWQDVKVIKINNEIENLRNKIRREIEILIKAQLTSESNDYAVDLIVQKEIIAMEIEFLERKRETLLNLRNIYKANTSKGPSRELTLMRLEREVEANRRLYQAFLEQTRGSEIEESLQKTSAEFKFKIVEPANKPLKPIKPNRLQIILMAALFGAGIGVGLIVLLEYMNHSFKSVDEVEKYLNLPVLGITPKIEISS